MNKSIVDQAKDVIDGDNIIKRIESLFNTMMADADFIPSAMRPLVMSLVKNYLGRAKQDDIRLIILSVRDEIIPWLLNDKNIDK